MEIEFSPKSIKIDLKTSSNPDSDFARLLSPGFTPQTSKTQLSLKQNHDLSYFVISQCGHSLDTEMALKSTQHLPNTTKKTITTYTQNLYPNLLVWGSKMESKMEPKGAPATGMHLTQNQKRFLDRFGSTWHSCWVYFGPPEPHLFEKICFCSYGHR